MRYFFLYISIVFIFLNISPNEAYGQRRELPPANSQSDTPIGFSSTDFFQDSTNLEQDSVLQVVLDTSDAIIIKAFDPFNENFITDTLLSLEFSRFDPARKNKWQHVHAGNVGTQTYSLLFHSTFNDRGRYWRDKAFRVYQRPLEDFEFYRLTQAITRASFYMKPTTEKGLFDLKFGRSFANDISISLDYRKGNQSANFLKSATIFEDLKFGISSNSLDRIYNCFYVFAFSRNEVEHNNGIQNITTPNITNPELVSVNSNLAQTNIRRTQHLFRHSLSIGKSENAYKLSLVHQVSLYNDRYKFSDTGISNTFSSDFYNNFNTLSLTSGLRMFSATRVFENKLSVLAIKHAPFVKDEPTDRLLLIEGGLSNQAILHNMEPVTTALNGSSIFGKLNWKILEKLRIKARGSFGLGAIAGSYQLQPEAQLKFKDLIEIEGGLDIHAMLPSFHQQVLLVNQQEIWANTFSNIRNQRIYGKMNWKKLIPFHVGLSQHSIQNYIYMDQNQMIQQNQENINVQQINAGIQLKLWRIHFDNDVYFQNTSSEIIRAPKLIGNHSFYYQGHLFKKAMWAKFGLDLRAHDPFRVYAFQPASGMFYLQDEFTTDWQFNLDGFFAFKIEKFRFTFRIMDILAPLRDEYLFYQYSAPLEPFDFRLGISWDFVD